MTPPNNHTCDFMSQPFIPPPAGNDYPSLPEHVPKITTGQCLLHPGINPWLPLRSGFIWRTIAPGGSDEEQLATVEHDHPLTLRRGDIIDGGVVAQRFEVLADMNAKRIGVIARRF